jgi:hypothetical protein
MFMSSDETWSGLRDTVDASAYFHAGRHVGNSGCCPQAVNTTMTGRTLSMGLHNIYQKEDITHRDVINLNSP